jgi:hypothetical protein
MSNNIVEALTRFLVIFKKRPAIVDGDWFFHWDYASVHTVAVVKEWVAAKAFRLIEHPSPCLPDLATVDFFLLLTIKKQMVVRP